MTGAFGAAPPHDPGRNGEAPPHRGPVLGVVEWFRIGERERVERVLGALGRVGISHLRTGISWADWMRPEASAWFDWLLPRLSAQVEVLPCVSWTPPALGLAPTAASPPRDPKGLADFVDVLMTRYGEHFTHLELWDESDRLSRWDRRLDPGWDRFCRMLGMAAYWTARCGKTPVLGATTRPDPGWLRMLAQRGVLAPFGVVGVHGSPATCPSTWGGWAEEIGLVREVLGAAGCEAEVWVTAASHPTWRHDEGAQVGALLEACSAPARRVYWATLEDWDASAATAEGFHADEREYHTGLCRSDGRPKLAFRLLQEGGQSRLRGVLAGQGRRGGASGERAVLITGGAGFIGTNLAEQLLSEGRRVIVYDNLSRPGVERNAAELAERFPDLVDIRIEDVRDGRTLRRSLTEADVVYHFAAQVAVTTSLQDPEHDQAVNIGGTVAVLEGVRALARAVPVVFTSTNKVYGDLANIELRRSGDRYEPVDEEALRWGLGEGRGLDFCSPYGCSKGAADQYMLDYARNYRVPTVVLRMSCIYGPHQCGTEDQGWVAHFVRCALEGKPVTVYGDGRQVRDLLYVSDLVAALRLAYERAESLAGRTFNMGGGPANALSLLELLAMLGELAGEPVRTLRGPWRTGDQRWYVSDTRAFQHWTRWTPAVSVREGLERLYRWMAGSRRSERGAGAGRHATGGAIGVARS